MRDIHIKKAMNGFIVTVGCQTLVFEGRETLIRELDMYLEHPDQVEQKYIKVYGMAGSAIPPAPPGYAYGNANQATTDSPALAYPSTGGTSGYSFTTAESEGPLRIR